jgi:hypothetical protein
MPEVVPASVSASPPSSPHASAATMPKTHPIRRIAPSIALHAAPVQPETRLPAAHACSTFAKVT